MINPKKASAYGRVSMLDKKRAPEALDVALGHRVADRVDRIESEHAAAVLVDTAELVVVQAAAKHTRMCVTQPYVTHHT